MTERSAVCRICLSVDVRMYSIVGTPLQFVYETLLNTSLNTADGRPVAACYFCHARLKSCYKLRETAAKAENLLTSILEKYPGATELSALISTRAEGLRASLCTIPVECSDTTAFYTPIVIKQEPESPVVMKYEIEEVEDSNQATKENADDIEADGKVNIIMKNPCSPQRDAAVETAEGGIREGQKRKNCTTKTNRGRKKKTSRVNAKPVEAINHEVASSHCDNSRTRPAETEKVSLSADWLGEDSEEDDETKKENMETEKEGPENKNTSRSNLKGKRIRERDFCFYCQNFILNFSRHMVRNHPAEPEVQLALANPKNSLKRKQLFSALRKKGNYVSNSQTVYKPVKKCRFSQKTDYLPCSKCLGFYSRKLLWRHVKKCNNVNSTKNAQVHAQNFIVRYVKVDKNLIKNVFPRMRPDSISLVAKKDKLICMFGAQYLRTHREHNSANVVSRKMRELAKLHVEVTKMKPDIKSFEQVLKPQYYDTLLHATKIVARYNEALQQFDAPTYAMNIATSIKQCCSIALLESFKMDATVQTASVQADLKTLSLLIRENWKFDISSQGADDLNVKKWNKTTIVPLAADLKLFKDYLCDISKQSSANLTQSDGKMNVEAFNNLVESTYCRVLIFNRRRPGELERLKLNDYNDYGNDSNKYEEVDKIHTSTEKILVGKLKRIVIRGKRGRGVPVLFSIEVQEDIKTILSVRHMYVANDNNLLFVKAGGSTVCGYKIFEKYAKASGAKNYIALTATRLRKHLATMTQLFTMTESDLEQLATFMGHTLSGHKNNHRLPSDVYQTAKISKLLLLMENGKADEYQGKTLDEIELNLDEEITGNEIENQKVINFDLEDAGPSQDVNLSRDEQVASTSQEISNKTPAKKKRTLVPWTTEQKNVVTKYFQDHIKYKQPPKRAECDELKNKYPTLLHNKDWLKIKVYIQNIYSKR